MRLFWFIYIILVSPLKEFIKIYYVKNPVLNSANYDRCMPTRPPVDPCTYGISKQTSPYCLNLEHAKLQNGMIIYGQSFYLSYNASFESVFFQAKHILILYMALWFFFLSGICNKSYHQNMAYSPQITRSDKKLLHIFKPK